MSDRIVPGTKIGNYELQKILGSGSFATAWRARHLVTNTPVAVKVIEKSSINTQIAKTRFLREISLLKKFDHPFIAQFYEVIEDKNFYYLCMEFIQNGNLLDYVNTNGRLSEDTARRYFEELIFVLEYMHIEKKVAHRDLKCENVLLDRYFNLKVIDFGLANVFSESNPKLLTACGSPAYAAPEVIKGEPYTQSADIWSAGILLYAVTVGGLPFDDDNIQRLLQKVVYTEPEYPGFLSSPLIDLLSKLICKDPAHRISIEKIKEHTWFSMAEYESIKQNSMLLSQSEIIPGEQNVIDHEIVEEMNRLKINTHSLHQSLLIGEFNELTAIYRILAREKRVESMKELIRKVAQSSQKAQNNIQQGQRLVNLPGTTRNTSQFPTSNQNRPNMPRFMAPNQPKPFTKPGGVTPRFLAPGTGAPVAAGRRLSRPVAIRRPVFQPQPEKFLESP